MTFQTQPITDMSFLHLWLTYACLTASILPAQAHVYAQGRSVPIVNVAPSKADAGYFFSLREIPLAQKQYIFFADLLKRAVFVRRDTNIVLSHTMTVKKEKGLDMYFSASHYNVTLSVKEIKQIDPQTTGYKGMLFVHHDSEKLKFAVHGFQSR